MSEEDIDREIERRVGYTELRKDLERLGDRLETSIGGLTHEMEGQIERLSERMVTNTKDLVQQIAMSNAEQGQSVKLLEALVRSIDQRVTQLESPNGEVKQRISGLEDGKKWLVRTVGAALISQAVIALVWVIQQGKH